MNLFLVTGRAVFLPWSQLSSIWSVTGHCGKKWQVSHYQKVWRLTGMSTPFYLTSPSPTWAYKASIFCVRDSICMWESGSFASLSYLVWHLCFTVSQCSLLILACFIETWKKIFAVQGGVCSNLWAKSFLKLELDEWFCHFT